MILELLFNLIKFLLMTIFGILPNIPSLPTNFITLINNFLDIIFNNGSALLNLFVHIETLKILAPIALVIINLDKVYHLILWVIKKLPFGMK